MIKQKRIVKHFFYSAQTQHSNAGDALINRELIKLMREHGKISCYTPKTPKNFLSEIGLKEKEAINGGLLKLLILIFSSRFKGEKVFLVQTPGDISLVKTTLNDVFKTLLFIVLSLLGIKILHLGVSLGDFSKTQKYNMRIRTLFAHSIGIRDELSMKKAQKIGLKHYQYFPDLSFNVPAQIKTIKEIKNIGLSFRNDHLDELKQNELIDNLKKSFPKDKFLDLNFTIIVQVERDLSFAKKIQSELSYLKSELLEIYSLSNLGNLYSNLDLVISNRLHVLLFSALNGAYFIAYVEKNSNKKIIGMFEFLGLTENIIEHYNPIDINHVESNINRLNNNFHKVSNIQNKEIIEIFSNIVA